MGKRKNAAASETTPEVSVGKFTFKKGHSVQPATNVDYDAVKNASSVTPVAGRRKERTKSKKVVAVIPSPVSEVIQSSPAQNISKNAPIVTSSSDNRRSTRKTEKLAEKSHQTVTSQKLHYPSNPIDSCKISSTLISSMPHDEGEDAELPSLSSAMVIDCLKIVCAHEMTNLSSNAGTNERMKSLVHQSREFTDSLISNLSSTTASQDSTIFLPELTYSSQQHHSQLSLTVKRLQETDERLVLLTARRDDDDENENDDVLEEYTEFCKRKFVEDEVEDDGASSKKKKNKKKRISRKSEDVSDNRMKLLTELNSLNDSASLVLRSLDSVVTVLDKSKQTQNELFESFEKRRFDDLPSYGDPKRLVRDLSHP